MLTPIRPGGLYPLRLQFRFLEVVAGTVQMVQGTDFDVESMQELPMDNYGDITPIAQWLSFFKGLTPSKKTTVFESCWALCSNEDQALIMHDLRNFMSKGGPSSEVELDLAAAT